jgi:hypothetical protein
MTGRAIILAVLSAWAAAPASAVTLRYQPPVGATMAYALSVTSDTRSVGAANRLRRSAARARLDGDLTVAKPAKPDQVAFICRITGGKAAIRIQSAIEERRVRPATERVVMTPRGETLSWDVLAGDTVELEPPVRYVLEPADLCVFEGYGAVPDRDLQPGDTWLGFYDEKPAKPDEEPQRITYRSTLLSVGRFFGRPYARIVTQYEVAPLPKEGAPKPADQEPNAVGMSGDVYWGFDTERGMILYYVETMRTSARLAFDHEDEGFAPTITSRTTLTAHMTAYNGVALGAPRAAGTRQGESASGAKQ